MITSQFKTAAILGAILLTINMAAKAIGSLQPSKPVLRGFIEGCEDKPQPCWYGVMPGVTLLQEAKLLVMEQGAKVSIFEDEGRNVFTVTYRFLKLQDVCEVAAWASLSQRVVKFITVQYCPSIYFGDIVEIYEDSKINNYCSNYGLGTVNLVYFSSDETPFNNLVFDTSVSSLVKPTSPYQRIFTAYFGNYPSPVEKDLQTWQGFISKKRYCNR